MLTRSQVARQIGRSIATVRKMEGRVLHPVVDSLGVHRFDGDEVEEAVDRVRATGRALDSSQRAFALGAVDHTCNDDELFSSHPHVPPARSAEVAARGLRMAKRRVLELERLRLEHARWRQRATDACTLLLDSLSSVDKAGIDAAERLGKILNEP